jgi:hypothetical protein
MLGRDYVDVCKGRNDLSDKISGLSNPPTYGRIEQHRLQHGRVQLGKEVFSKCHHWDLRCT